MSRRWTVEIITFESWEIKLLFVVLASHIQQKEHRMKLRKIGLVFVSHQSDQTKLQDKGLDIHHVYNIIFGHIRHNNQ
jgi:hypothetical protein